MQMQNPPGERFPQSTEETVPAKGQVTNKNYRSQKGDQTERESAV